MFGLAPPWWGSGNVTLTPQGWDSSTNTTSVNGAIALSDGNRLASYTATSFAIGSIKAYRPRLSGKYYWEVAITMTGFAYPQPGWTNIGTGATGNPYASGYWFSLYPILGTITLGRSGGGTYTTSIGAVASGSIVMIAVDIDNDMAWFGVNGVWKFSGDPAAGTNPTLSKAGLGADANIVAGRPAINFDDKTAATASMRGAAADVTYAVPSGFKAWYDPDDTAYDA